jgi:hypothetical protein
VVAELEALEHPDRIADFLEAQNIKGEPMSADFCPVAVYVMHKADRSVAVCPESVAAFHIHDGETEAPMIVLPETSPLREFVNLFDGGHYPALEDEQWD